MSEQFSAELEAVLRKCGWHPQRSVPVTHWIEALSREGLVPTEDALHILQNFGGLTITPERSEENLFYPDAFTFDPLLDIEYDRVNYWRTTHGVRLFPVATFQQGPLLFHVDGGSIVKAWERHFNLVGKTLPEALEVLVFARRYPVRYSTKSAPNWWELEHG